MASYSQRRITRKHGHWGGIVAGIFILLSGLYFLFGISANTDRRNAKCTESVVGVVTASEASGSKYLTTIEYTPEDWTTSIDVETKKQYEVGSEITVNYEPMTPKHVFIEGITPTGASDRITGLIMIAAGAAMAVGGYLIGKKLG